MVGYPRSGNVWISRMLGEALDVRVVGIKGGKDSVAAEGFERKGIGYVKQAHLWPGEKGHLRVNAQRIADGTFLHVVRDPRDIAVSMAHYWGWSLDEALDKMIFGPGPLELPPWNEYVESWFECYVPILRYEDFHAGAEKELDRVLTHLKLKPKNGLVDVVRDQSFAVKRKKLERNGDKYPFGRVAQLKHMRKGAVGDWKQDFSKDQRQIARDAWIDQLRRLGYNDA